MNKLLIGLVVAAASWLLLMLSLKGMAKLWKKGARKAADRALAGEKVLMITSDASLLGADFPGPNLPPRTSGVLAVTDKQVYFMPWFPRKSISLPHDWITEVQLKATYGSFSTSVPCLVFVIRDLKDPYGTIAWLVHEPREWLNVINAALK